MASLYKILLDAICTELIEDLVNKEVESGTNTNI